MMIVGPCGAEGKRKLLSICTAATPESALFKHRRAVYLNKEAAQTVTARLAGGPKEVVGL